MNAPNGTQSREIREIIREEPLMRSRILSVLAGGPHTVPEIAEAIGRPADEAMFWVMSMRRYGWVREIKDVTPEGYFRYQAVQKETRP
ncbi:MAG: MarR family transcriptional regulator [Candidatus Limnocylindrales bacterium]